MTTLQVALIIIGILTIIISSRMVDRSQKVSVPATGRAVSIEESLTEEEQMKIKHRIEEILAEISEEVIVQTDDTLSKISNEKIIAVSEFSDQILEKINRNHEEVIFLYNMLNEKEDELKSVVREINTSKKRLQEILETKQKKEPVTVKSDKSLEEAKPATQAAKMERQAKELVAQEAENAQLKTEDTKGVAPNSNSEILSLYNQGKTVIEISKLLHMGQGEVKLVIDLFKGKK